jgi:hypothetical protein
MQAYKFDAWITENGIISLPHEPVLFNREVEIIVIPKQMAPPEGYTTLEEFRTTSKISLTKLLNDHGIHQ